VKRMRRRILALSLAVASLVPAMGPASAQTPDVKVLFYAGTCELKIVFHFNEPMGFGTLGNPGYWLEVLPAGPLMPCQLSDDPVDPQRNTDVTANGNSSLFDCNAAVGSGGWSQDWRKANGVYTPQPVDGGRHKVFGSWDHWVIETEGRTITQFAGAIFLKLDAVWAAQAVTQCSNGSLWELHMTGTQVFQDPQL
jgi:hypothetical protein